MVPIGSELSDSGVRVLVKLKRQMGHGKVMGPMHVMCAACKHGQRYRSGSAGIIGSRHMGHALCCSIYRKVLYSTAFTDRAKMATVFSFLGRGNLLIDLVDGDVDDNVWGLRETNGCRHADTFVRFKKFCNIELDTTDDLSKMTFMHFKYIRDIVTISR